MIKIYCEDGAVTKQIRKIGKLPDFILVSFPFENKNKRTTDSIMPSNLTADSTFVEADNIKINIGNTSISEKADKITDIIGKEHFNDIRHFDTAYKEGCKIFITPDKKDISSKFKQLFELTGIMTFHCDDTKDIQDYCEE